VSALSLLERKTSGRAAGAAGRTFGSASALYARTCVWCSSPWVDLVSGATMTTKAAVDPLISRPYLLELAGAYLHGADPRLPLISPIHGSLAGLPPMLIQSGSAETLLARRYPPGLRRRRSRRSCNVGKLARHDPRVASSLSATCCGPARLAAVGAFVRNALDSPVAAN
jgi:acetyl esterase/lipase